MDTLWFSHVFQRREASKNIVSFLQGVPRCCVSRPRCVQGCFNWLGFLTFPTSTDITNRLVSEGLMLALHFHQGVSLSSLGAWSGLCFHWEVCRPDAESSTSCRRSVTPKPWDKMQRAVCPELLSLIAQSQDSNMDLPSAVEGGTPELSGGRIQKLTVLTTRVRNPVCTVKHGIQSSPWLSFTCLSIQKQFLLL